MDEPATTNDQHSRPGRRLVRRHPIAVFLLIGLGLSWPVMIALLISGQDFPPARLREWSSCWVVPLLSPP